MSAVTQCSQCGTRFKVSAEQLETHDGMVRCGRCHQVFNALEHLHQDEPSPQLQLAIEPEEIATLPATLPTDATPTQGNIEHIIGELEPALPPAPPVEPPPTDEFLPVTETPFTDEVVADKVIANEVLAENAPITLAQQIQFLEDAPVAIATNSPPRKSRILFSLMLLLTLLLQILYFFRVDIAARLPGLKPLMVQACNAVACSIGLPQNIDWVTIDSSELKAEPEQVNLITLNVLLHNRAAYSQAYPSFELTLTDTQENVLARRLFHPAEYLKTGSDTTKGMPANREIEISLPLDTSQLKPSGYRLFLFYPQQSPSAIILPP